MHWRCMIIDDEAIARAHLCKLLENHQAHIEIIGEAANGIEAVDAIERLSPDVLFLDVQMPGMNGFEVLRKISRQPSVVFTTAYDEYALSAFKENAVDYLLKPIAQDDLCRTVDKLHRFASVGLSMHKAIATLLSNIDTRAGSRKMTRLKVTTGDSIQLIPVEKIVYFEADEKYTTVCSEIGVHVIDTPLAELEQQLSENEFVRIHRKHIVNVNFIAEMKKWFDRKLRLKLRGYEDKEFIVSRGYVDRINNL